MDPVAYTICKIDDAIGTTLNLIQQKDFNGYGSAPLTITGNKSFPHNADSSRRSVGAVVYKPDNQTTMWTFAWSNTDDSKKVYTEFLAENNYLGDWDTYFGYIKKQLQASNESSSVKFFDYKSDVKISTDENDTPTMNANLSKA